MKTYVVSKMNGTHAKGFRVPKLYNYMKDFEVKSSVGQWAVIIVDDGFIVSAAAEADPDIFVFDTAVALDTVLGAAQRNAVNARLAATDWAVTVVVGDTVRIVLNKIRIAMGHTAESWGLGL